MTIAERFSIRLLMAIVFFVAADFAIVRALWNSPGSYVGVAIISLPMANLLLLVLPKMKAGCDSRIFWMDFEAVGWTMMFLVASLAWNSPGKFFLPIDWLDKHRPIEGEAENLALQIVCALTLYTAPQLLAATLGGRLLARYRVVIERR